MLHLCIADADRNKLRKLPALFLTVLILDSKIKLSNDFTIF